MGLLEVDWSPPPRQLRQFAAIFAVAGAVLGLVLYLGDKPVAVSASIWTAAALVGLAGLVRPSLVRPVYVAMMAAALPVGFVASTVLLVLIYYVVLTPIGVVARRFGYDPMGRRRDAAEATYWVPRRARRDVRRYFDQY